MIGAYFCKACGVVHADSVPIVTPEALSVQQVAMVREICRLRARGHDLDRCLGMVEICALLGVDWRRSGEFPELVAVPKLEVGK